MISAVVGFAVVAGLLTVTPGIDTALVLRASVTRGTSAAYATVLGISVGVLAWGVAAAVGITALLNASRLAYDALRLAGAAYLLWLGTRLLWNARTSHASDADGTAPAAPGPESPWASFRRGLLTNLLNPKIGVFYLAVLPQFLPPGDPVLVAGVALALVHVVEGLIWFSLLIWGTHMLRSWLQRPAVGTWMDRITGGVLVGFGLKVALTQRR